MLEQCVRVDKIWLQNASVLQANVRVTTTHDNSSYQGIIIIIVGASLVASTLHKKLNPKL